MKLGCVIQGNIRVPVKPILDELSRHFDEIVLSTWEDDRERCPSGKYELVISEPLAVRGMSNRNLQRYSTARGIEALSAANCTHVLKWRTDMLPTKMDIDSLLSQCHAEPEAELGGRIVTGAFRHLSVSPDWFSSFPDLYAFSTLKGMELLWSDAGFDYTIPYNMPQRMLAELNIETNAVEPVFLLDGEAFPISGTYAYDAHTELYALFRHRVWDLTGVSMNHQQIVKKYFSLIDDDMLGICWLSGVGALPYRPVRQGYHVDWWQAGVNSSPRLYSFAELQNPAGQDFVGRVFQAASSYKQRLNQALMHVQYKARGRHGLSK